MIVDFHTHCYPRPLAEKVARTDPSPRKLPVPTTEDLLGQMTEAGVDLSVVLPVATRPDTVRDTNQFAQSIQSDRLLSFAAIHPDRPDSLDQLDELAEQGVKGVKFHPPFQHFSLDDPRYRPLYRKIGDLGLITVIHPGRALPEEEHYCYPSTFARVADDFMGAPVILAHMGGILIQQAELDLLPHLPVHLDTALWPIFMSQERFLQLIDLVGLDRVLFGTDYPYTGPADCVKHIQDLPLTDREKDQLFSGNALTLLRLHPCQKPTE